MKSEEESYATVWQLPERATDYVHHQRQTIGLVLMPAVNVNGDPHHPGSTPARFHERPVLFSDINHNPRWSYEEAPWIECAPVAWRFA